MRRSANEEYSGLSVLLVARSSHTKYQIFSSQTYKSMARKKKLPSQQKRQQVVDSQGWTHIIKGPNNHVSAQYANTALHRRLSNTNMSFTLETYLSKLQNHYIARWNESSCFNNLSRIFEQYISTIGTTSIANCVCLGLGSITAGVETPGFELAALMSMLKILGKFVSIHR